MYFCICEITLAAQNYLNPGARMKIFLAQQNYHIGNFEANQAKILDAISEARNKGADLVVFSELCICGYPPRDFLEFGDFISRCRASIEKICAHTGDTGVIVGAPSVNHSSHGKRLHNSAWLLHQGKIIQVVHKTLLPNYDIFDEFRYFEPASSWNVVEFKGWKIALTICEDIWNLGDHPLYPVCPMDRLMDQQPELMINISASPFDYLAGDARKEIIRRNVVKYGLPMVYCNAVGAQTEVVYDGASLVFDRFGEPLQQLPTFREAMVEVNLEKQQGNQPAQEEDGGHRGTNSPEIFPAPSFLAATTTNLPPYDPRRGIGSIHEALILGIRDYFSKMGFQNAIIGSSGGIDSAVTLALATEALGKDRVRTVLMPSPYSSSHSLKDAQELSKILGNQTDIIPIETIYRQFMDSLAPVFTDTPFGLAEENLQSRIRGNILMSVANKFGYILLNTSNKSELSTGYGTLYGDMAGGLSVLGDLYKTQVYELAGHINRDHKIIPDTILQKAPSAELRPEQKDTDSLPDYGTLDPLLYDYIEKRLGPKEIIRQGFNPELVARVLKLVNMSEYKRNQFCPIIRVSVKAFGVGRKMPIVGKYLS
jgi:NAD+ synthase (glutamine-hydrolysing)